MRMLPLVFFATLCSCSKEPPSAGPVVPLPAHNVTSNGTAVAGAPEPEVVQLRKIEEVDRTKHVTVGNIAGDYVLVCNLDANKEYGVQSCLSPRPQRDYLLFRANTKWLVKGAKEPIHLQFMEDFSVKYNNSENIGLMPATKSDDENFGVYWLLSWTAANPPHQN